MAAVGAMNPRPLNPRLFMKTAPLMFSAAMLMISLLGRPLISVSMISPWVDRVSPLLIPIFLVPFARCIGTVTEMGPLLVTWQKLRRRTRLWMGRNRVLCSMVRLPPLLKLNLMTQEPGAQTRGPTLWGLIEKVIDLLRFDSM